jgi:hypothetical protein
VKGTQLIFFSELRNIKISITVNERLLQFIWQSQYFNTRELATTGGETILTVHPGILNHNQGPDFMDARIRIGGTLWVGKVELHVRSSDWKRHRHEKDLNYQTVILHVVWEDDDASGAMHVLELKNRVPKLLLARYRQLMNAKAFIPCEKSISSINELILRTWKERLLAERLISKTQTIKTFLEQNNYHWEETCWWLIARNFGIKINADAFEAMARSIPLKLISRQKNSLFILEALLLGQAGLLNREFRDEYANRLKKEYQFLQINHNLKYHSKVSPVYLRLRPSNFPTLRLAQLAVLLHSSEHLFSKIKESSSIKSVKSLFIVTASAYWDTHYLFDTSAKFKKKTTGAVLVESIIINTVAPLLFYYGQYHGNAECKDKAINWLEETAAEVNTVISGFRQLGIIAQNAFESQALIELKASYCDQHKCLDCAVGNSLLRSSDQT